MMRGHELGKIWGDGMTPVWVEKIIGATLGKSSPAPDARPLIYLPSISIRPNLVGDPRQLAVIPTLG
jgi:hypothetical protein